MEDENLFIAHSTITMYWLILKAAVFLAIAVAFMGIDAYEDISSHDVKNEDVYRAFNFSSDYWLLAVNFPRVYTQGRRCTFFHIKELREDSMNYSSHYFVNNSWQRMDYVGTFFTTPLENGSVVEEPQKNNSFYASRTSEKWHPQNYTVVSSDYNSCLILRVQDFYNGYACMVLVSEPPANTTSLPWECQLENTTACNETCISEQVYEKNCTKPENVTR
uniref:Putative lipocalin-2 1 n=1 Tax=Amblyomma cajennense TaxID=34607 RepID=A0A023FMN2_AMBCJ